MRKKFSPPLFPIALSIVLIVVLIIGHWQVNKQEKRIDEAQTIVIENSQITAQITNFINSSLSQIQQ
jgi:sensor domain CHASE-containing protein